VEWPRLWSLSTWVAITETVTGLTNGTAYTFTVAAIDGVGPGPASASYAGISPL
jgi:hypothetical protein